jgi:glycerol-3-phosphate dehydrogenase
MRWSRGTHIVLDGSLLPGGHGLLVPETADGRLIFALPWLGSTLVGTTDVPVESPDADPEPPQEDVEFLLSELARYLPSARDAQVRSAFTGIRPLVARRDTSSTAALARTHRVMVSESGMVTITGGKWTTARLMGEHAVDKAAQVGGLERRRSRTSRLPLHGAPGGVTGVEVFRGAVSEPGYLYGTGIEAIGEMEAASPELGQLLDPALPYRLSQVAFAARHEMAQTVEDVLARRTRSLMLDVEAAVGAAGEVATVMARELGRDERWAEEQVEEVDRAARAYRAPQRA